MGPDFLKKKSKSLGTLLRSQCFMIKKYQAIQVPGVAVPSAASGRRPHFPENVSRYQFPAHKRAQNPKSFSSVS
jgi:hypothetical protein